MFCLWMCLSLLYALQSRVSSDQAVLLICNKTVEVKPGANVTLNCSIKWNDGSNCRVQNAFWEDTNGSIPCESSNTKYICEQDPLSYVSLTILEVVEEKNVTVEIKSNCGMDKSSIRVRLLPGQNRRIGTGGGNQEKSHVMVVVLGVFAAATLVSVFSV